MSTVYVLFYHRPTAPDDQWDVCGVFQTLELAEAALDGECELLGVVPRTAFAIDPYPLDRVVPS